MSLKISLKTYLAELFGKSAPRGMQLIEQFLEAQKWNNRYIWYDAGSTQGDVEVPYTIKNSTYRLLLYAEFEGDNQTLVVNLYYPAKIPES